MMAPYFSPRAASINRIARGAKPLALSLCFAVASLAALQGQAFAQQSATAVSTHPVGVGTTDDGSRQPLHGYVPKQIASATLVGRVPATQMIRLALTLPLRNTSTLTTLLHDLYDPRSPKYHQYLSGADFKAQFSPSDADYNSLIAFAKAQGFTVTATPANSLLLNVQAPASVVEKAFGVQLNNYKETATGRIFFAPDREPSLDASFAVLPKGIIGLDNAVVPIKMLHKRPITPAPSGTVGTGMFGGYTPSDIKNAYGLNDPALTGAGQVLGLFELDGYTASDITGYEKQYNLPATPIQNILVDNYSGAAGSGAIEVTLDIEMMLALTPGASNILVYEAPITLLGVVDLYNQIAVDNKATVVSSSWDVPESRLDPTAPFLPTENTIFQMMAAQGQSMFNSSGDKGAYSDDGLFTPVVFDPASQPFVTGVGGTTITTTKPGGTYVSETTWNNGFDSAGGGGISINWGLPDYQAGAVFAASLGSITQRNVPDVSLDADPNTGYSIFFGGGLTVVGGTSAAAPLWASYAALANQKSLAAGNGLIGFINPAVYRVGESGVYTTLFHDIADGSNNLVYPAVTGYDLATGWGSFNGTALLDYLAGVSTLNGSPLLSAVPNDGSVTLTWSRVANALSYNLYRGTAQGKESLYKSGLTGSSYQDTGVTNGTSYFYQLSAVTSKGESAKSNEVSVRPNPFIFNPGFEQGLNAAPWSATSGVINTSPLEVPHTGKWKAWLCGYGTNHTDALAQTFSVPNRGTSVQLSYYLHVDTTEPSKVKQYDTLTVYLLDNQGFIVATVGSFSNLDAAPGFKQMTFNLSPYKGRSFQLAAVGTEDQSFQTSFVLDDFAVTVK